MSSILRSAYSNQTSTVYGIFMNFFVIPREIQEINEWGESK